MTSLSTLFRDVTCAMAATLVTLVLCLGFVESTSAAPFHVTAATQTRSA